MIQQYPYDLYKQRYDAAKHEDVTGSVITRTYRGGHEQAIRQYKIDASELATKGYFPTNQVWIPGSYGCGSFIVALLLCFIFVGILVFIYMLFVKPAGELNVTYEFREINTNTDKNTESDTKICPECAETIKEAANICRYCRYEFTDEKVVTNSLNDADLTKSENEKTTNKEDPENQRNASENIISQENIKKISDIIRKSKSYIKNEEFKDAVISISRAIEIDDSDGEMYYIRAFAYMKLNDKNRMKHDLNRSAELGYEKARKQIRDNSSLSS